MESMEIDEMKKIVMDYVSKEYLEDEDEEVNYNTPLISSGFVDSFSMVSLLVFLENKFKIKIPPDKATPEAFNSVNNIVDLISQHLQQTVKN